MHVAIIGAGSAGLCAARHALATVSAHGIPFSCVVFERAAELGGTWVYTDRTGLDEFGLPIHTSMYRSLRTNLPKEVMGFPDFSIPDNEKSYISAKEVLDFLNLYAEYFKLKDVIKFNHYVTLVKPVDEKWEITAKDLRHNKPVFELFDSVMVCNGHYHTPLFPEILHMVDFKGPQIHSHDYRVPAPFTNKRVLVVGAGPSGMDLALEISTVAKNVLLSHHLTEVPKTTFPDNFKQKPDVKEITKTGALFNDGTIEDFDIIFYCTGYKYEFPFLDEACGITAHDNYVKTLYKHLVNISHPTMCFVGLPFYVCASQMIDLQVRFFMKMLTGEMKLPSKEEMIDDTEKYMAQRWERGYKLKQAHMLGPDQDNYFKDLSSIAHIKRVQPVMTKLHNESSKRFMDDLVNFREDVYRILDDETFFQTK